MKKEKKEVYKSIDILSKEMAMQYFNDNINNVDKLSKEVELELLNAQIKKENKEIDDNLEVLFESFGEENEKLNSEQNEKEKELNIKKIKSSSNFKFDKTKNKPKGTSTFKSLNSKEINKNINLNMESNDVKKKMENLKISSEKKSSVEPLKSFYKKVTQASIKSGSYSKLLKNDNSTIKTKYVNSSPTNNDNENYSNIKSVKSLFDKKTSDFKSNIKANSIKDNKMINEKNDSNIEKKSFNSLKKSVIIEDSKPKNEINKSRRGSKLSKQSINKASNFSQRKSISSNDNNSNNSVNTIIINNDNDTNKSNKSKDSENNKKENNISRKVSKNFESNSKKNLNKIESISSDSSSQKSNNKSSSHSSGIKIKKSKIINNQNFDNSDSSNLIKELSKEDLINTPKPKKKEERKSKPIEECKNVEILSFVSSEKSKAPINLQKPPKKNFIIYRKKKRTPKQFYEHQLFLMHRQEKINNSKKAKNLAKENETLKEFPGISPYSEEIINNKGDYVPIYERTIELQNQKKTKIMLNERKKKKQLDDMIKKYSNSSFYVDKNEIDQFYLTQISWNDKIKKRNKDLFKKKQEEIKNEEDRIMSYTMEISEKTKKLAENKIKYLTTTFNTSLTKNKRHSRSNIFERLYEESKIHENKMNNLTKAYYAPLFKPNIIRSYSFQKPYRTNNPKPKIEINNNNQGASNNFTAYLNNFKKKIKFNNISKNISNISKKIKNKKKNYSMTFEDINLPKNKTKKSRNKINLSKSTNNSKSTKGTYNVKNASSYGISSVNTKIITSSKEITPLPIKLGEIKEIDSIVAESTGRNNNGQENKNTVENKSKSKSKVIEESNNNPKEFNSSNDSTSGKNKNNIPSNRKESTKKNNYFDSNEIKEEEKEDENNESKMVQNSNNNQVNKSKLYIKNESLKKNNEKETPKIRPSSKITLDKNYSKELVKPSTKSKISNNKINQFLQNNTQSFNDILSPTTNLKESNKLNLLISNEHNFNDNLLMENSLLNDSGSFGNYQPSNLLENITQRKEKEHFAEKINKNKKIEKAEEIEKNNEEPDKKKKNKYKFDAYNDDENEDSEDKESVSFEEISSLKEKKESMLIKKFKMIDDMEERNKSTIANKNTNKNKNNDNKDRNNNDNLYMLNFMENAPNAIKEPFIFTDNEGIFFEYFKKKE